MPLDVEKQGCVIRRLNRDLGNCGTKHLGSTILSIFELGNFNEEQKKAVASEHLACWWFRIKDPVFWRKASQSGWLELQASLADGILTFRNEDIGWGTRPDQQDENVLSAQAFRSLSLVLSRVPDAANPRLLPRVINLIKCEAPGRQKIARSSKNMENEFWHGARGLVRLLLWHDPHAANDPMVREAVRNEYGNPRRRYHGFAEDVREVRFWKKWCENQSIGGLPAEVLEEIVMIRWEFECLLPVPEGQG